ncbi:hypothetical protein vBAmePPT11V19_00035 [Alteromonas phage vB_AmeP_PT11-V19]|nr:hypothetical protein vBAmePPT11V19_00035 [Alteromonas phage vB_AmeP_PT11-V19]
MSEDQQLLLADFAVFLEMAAEEQQKLQESFSSFLTQSLSKFIEERNEQH